MSVNLGTSASAYASAWSAQRRVFKTTTGKLVVFAVFAQSGYYSIKYTASDDGITWDDWTDINSSNLTTGNGYLFDIAIDSSNNFHIVLGTGDNYLYYKKLTYSGGTWTVPASWTYLGYPGRRPTILIRSNGDIWIVSTYSSTSSPYYIYSTNGGSSWSTYAYFDSVEVSYGHCLIEVGSDLWFICQGGNKLHYFIYNGSWGSEQTIASSGITNSGIGVVKVSDSEIYVAAATSSGIKVYKYNGSTWDSGTLLSNNANDSNPAISNIGGKVVVTWRDYDGTYYNISYRKWNGSSWESQVDLTSDSDVDNYPSSAAYDDRNLLVIWTTGSSNPWTIYFDSVLINPPTQQTILSDAKIHASGLQHTILSNAFIVSTRQTILSDAKIHANAIQQTTVSDAKVVDRFQQTSSSDAHIKAEGIQNTILSDALILVEVITDVSVKFNSVKQVISNINQKFNSAKRVLKDAINRVNFVKGTLFNVVNDFRMRSSNISDVDNDIRFLRPYMKPGLTGPISFGKEFIHIYFNSIEQTDIDIDSIEIHKVLNAPSTASFDLGRPYDVNIPDLETIVEIKYASWTLYKGYITEINPTETPEKINIICNDRYWYDNRNNVHFLIGYNPIENVPPNEVETYFETISKGLQELGAGFGIGNFTPQTINCYGEGTADAITALVTEAGNYAWFYDVNWSKKLWTAGQGTIVNLERQSLGKNITLYQVLNHQFKKDVSQLINQYRVQMGNTIYAGGREMSCEVYSSYEQYLQPHWDSAYEVLAYKTLDGYGCDYPNPDEVDLYKDVFRVYELPYLNPQLSQYSDRQPPFITIYAQDWKTSISNIGETVTDGFTIDYEKGLLIFNEARFWYKLAEDGGFSEVRWPLMKLHMWKKDLITWSTNPVNNPLTFVTVKLGNYPKTITKDLRLSDLTIQIGTTYRYYYKYYTIPGWDDTEFAKDYALWQLSKTCDPKISGTIEITIDAVCFYGITLTNRIYVAGITEAPLNITSIDYNLANFTVTLIVENGRTFKRKISVPWHGE